MCLPKFPPRQTQPSFRARFDGTEFSPMTLMRSPLSCLCSPNFRRIPSRSPRQRIRRQETESARARSSPVGPLSFFALFSQFFDDLSKTRQFVRERYFLPCPALAERLAATPRHVDPASVPAICVRSFKFGLCDGNADPLRIAPLDITPLFIVLFSSPNAHSPNNSFQKRGSRIILARRS